MGQNEYFEAMFQYTLVPKYSVEWSPEQNSNPYNKAIIYRKRRVRRENIILFSDWHFDCLLVVG